MPIDKRRNYLYKDGKAEIFEGPEILKKVKEGWTDHPDKKSFTQEELADLGINTKDSTSGAVTMKGAGSGAVTMKKSP